MKESSLKKKCIRWMRADPRVGELWWYCPADRFTSGIPDLIICSQGRFLWVEFKAERGVVSKIQEYTHRWLGRCGARGFVCRSFDRFKAFIYSINIKEAENVRRQDEGTF